MIITQLEVRQFRNIGDARLEFHQGVHVITGPNGQGKTNLLESIYLIAIPKSFRPVKDHQMVQYGQSFYDIRADIRLESEEKKVRIYWDAEHGKLVWLNQQKMESLKDYVGIFPVVLLIPEDLEITKGGPSMRRRFLDIVLSQASRQYLNAAVHYRKILKHRNTLLLQDQPDASLLEAFTIQLSKYAAVMIRHRLEFMDWLKSRLPDIYGTISGKSDSVTLHYLNSIGKDVVEEENIRITWLDRIPREVEQKRTLIGPHLDDFLIYLNKKPIRYFGSQGENKTMVIALKILEYFYLQHSHTQRPLLLFDDIFGELDPVRVQNMLSLFGEIGQVFLTSASDTVFKFSPERMPVYYYDVMQGKVKERA